MRLRGSSLSAWVAAVAAIAACAVMSAGILAGCAGDTAGPKTQQEAPGAPPEKKAAGEEKAPAAGAAQLPGPPDAEGWQALFDGKTLAGWKVTDFGGQGPVGIVGGEIVAKMGQGDMTGVTWAGGAIPRIDYELSAQAKKTDGSDFFCGLTFPYKDTCASFIVGGWGGTLCGISSLDGFDASENETTKFMEFKTGEWYTVRVRVTAAKIEAWIDDDKMVDVEIGDRKVSVRWEVESSQPLGLAAWRTGAAWRDIRIRKISE